MIKPELYKKTVDILFESYFKDELAHGNCSACAVGNMVAANMGYKLIRFPNGLLWENCAFPAWDRVFSTHENSQDKNPEYYRFGARTQIDSTGYHWEELAKIEFAFESADKGNNENDYMFNGLVAVLEVLKEIHQVDDNTDQITRFKSHYANLIT